ncbi:MAG TPA: metallopeptidase family protein [Candidatus Saccharimonadales bacterium]|nr:metallopeptidase family protein [Candidatus Saccharimonadales bacterium]
MVIVSDQQFQQLITDALASMPGEHAANIQNVAILWEPEPTQEHREKLQLRDDQTLFGLYEGVPLAQRQGTTRVLPDKITIFKGPMERAVDSLPNLLEHIRHTLWHEIGHYYGLDHKRIRELE